MKVLLFHPVRLPPKNYGGAERVVIWLAEALRDFGHEVVVAALEGSELPRGVHLLPVPVADRSAVSLARRIPRGTDIVHFHAPPESGYFDQDVPPALTTIHGNGKPGETFRMNTVFLSRDHARRHGSSFFVYNGVNPEEFALAETLGRVKHRDSPLFFSKTTLRTKNLAGAMKIAQAAKMKLTIAGGSRPLALRLKALAYGHRWVGSISGQLKAQILAEASHLLFPVIWAIS
jgi:glycosyltransferase involved in cell wall biosynthesis